MEVKISRLAKMELMDAIEFYELEFRGLGLRFKEEVKSSLLRIQQFPDAWQHERGEVRKFILHKFPYKILYSVEKNHIFIIAISHQHRKPYYWIDDF